MILFTSTLFADTKIQGWWVIDQSYLKKIVQEMEKTASSEDQKMLKMFMPMVEKRMKLMTMVIDAKNFSQIYGDRKQTTPYTLLEEKDGSYVLQMGQRKMTLKLIDGRLVNAAELNGKRPAMYLRRLSAAEVKLRQAAILKASMPPGIDVKAGDRLRFLIYKATPKQVDSLLATQPDLLKLSFSHDGYPPLATAIREGKTDLVQKLIKAGAALDFVDKRKQTLLFIAASSFKPQKGILELLVQKGLDPKVKGKDDSTLLIAYCDNGKDVEVIDYLLGLGLGIDDKSSWGHSALSEAMRNDWMTGVNYLTKKGADIQALSENMDKIARKGDLTKLKFFADNKIYQDDQGKTALMEALSYSRLKNKEAVIPPMIKLFKATVNMQNVSKETALFHTKELTFIKLLIENGADPKLRDKSENTVLHYCADADVAVLKYYVEEQKMDVNLADNRSGTPLHQAVLRKDNLANIKYLLSKGADANAGAKKNVSTPLDYAVSGDYENKTELYDLLIKHGADIKNDSMMLEVLKNAIFKDDKKTITYFHEKGVSLQVNPKWHQSVFWYAIYSDKIELLKYFIELGVDPKVKNAAGKDALALAKEMKKPAAIALLSK
jgi:ankyrin repeat protein